MATKIIITRKSDDVITNIVDTTKTVENGLLVTDSTGEYIIGFINECNKYDAVDTDITTIVSQKYKYTVEGGFVVNTNYKDYMSVEEQISNLGQQLAQEKLSNMQKDSILSGLGQQVSDLKLQVIKLQGGTK